PGTPLLLHLKSARERAPAFLAGGLLALGDAGALAGPAAQVIELRPAHHATADHLDAVHVGRIERENALHTFAEAHLADGETAVVPAVRAGDAHRLEVLHAGAFAFDHAHANAQRIAGAEFGDFLPLAKGPDGLGLEFLDQTHDG